MSTAIARATFTPQIGNKTPINVHFNPVSLQLSINNTLEDKGKGKDRKQYITKTAAKLTMDLVFDSSDRGSDVRLDTGKIAKLMEPGKQEGDKKVPTIVLFEWGTFKFQGLVESYKETLDFFSSQGLPLRASINLTLSRQEEVFEPSPAENIPSDNSVEVPASTGQSASQLASLGGAPQDQRAIAAANDQESLRFPSGAFTIDPSIQLSPAVAFASGGLGISAGAGFGIGGGIGIGASAGFGASAGIGIGASAGIGVGASVGVGINGGAGFGGGIGVGASAGFSGGIGGGAGLGMGAAFGASAGISSGAGVGISTGVSAGIGISGSVNGAEFSVQANRLARQGRITFGGSASAGVSAMDGAFAGLRTPRSRRNFNRLDTSRFLPGSETTLYSTAHNASFQLGGQARIEGSASLTTNVTSRIQFEER